MSAVALHYGRVDTAGKVVFDAPAGWLASCGALRGALVEVTIRKRRKQRSLAQNRAYFGFVVEVIAEHCGYTKDEAHEALAWRFLREGEPDAPLPKRRSTASLTDDEFAAYVAQVKQFAAEELGIFIPDAEAVSV